MFGQLEGYSFSAVLNTIAKVNTIDMCLPYNSHDFTRIPTAIDIDLFEYNMILLISQLPSTHMDVDLH